MTTVGGWLAAHPELDRRDREVLLCRAAGLTRAQVLARPERALDSGTAARLEGWAARRRAGEPVAYLLGVREFWGLELEVTPAVLVPRPETELLVEAGVATLTTGAWVCRPLRVLDLGTGSGAIAIALALEAADRNIPVAITASDVSAAALAVAARNGRRHDVTVNWREGDWFRPFGGRFHLVVSNPPYVAEDDPHLADLTHEPRAALAAGPRGLDALRAITAGAPEHLEPDGVLMLEHGYDQGPAVRGLLTAAGFCRVETLTDLAGHERVTRGRWTGRTR